MRRGNKERIDWVDIESPCVKICKLIDNVCVGCLRTSEEITQWAWMTHEERSAVIKEIQSDRCPT